MIIFSIGKRIKDYSKVKIYSFVKKLKSHSGDDMFKEELPSEIKRLYYPNGSIKLETYHKNGKLEGIANYYYESGGLKAREFYKDNTLHGLSKWYYESGEIKSERYYKDGNLTIKKEYDKAGNLISNSGPN